jgi:uncharacterized protein YejL (UPF0352 family)
MSEFRYDLIVTSQLEETTGMGMLNEIIAVLLKHDIPVKRLSIVKESDNNA